MAEYRTLLIRAISRLDANTLTARESVYARARAALAALLELTSFYPWCAGWEKQLCELFALYVEAKSKRRTCSIMTICCCTGRKQ
jgi:hypothetical protein